MTDTEAIEDLEDLAADALAAEAEVGASYSGFSSAQAEIQASIDSLPAEIDAMTARVNYVYDKFGG